MLTYLAFAILAFAIIYTGNTYRCFLQNLAKAKQSGLPYVCTPVFNHNRYWQISHRFLIPLIQKLPQAWYEGWIGYTYPNFLWKSLYHPFEAIESDAYLVVSPAHNTLYVADPEAIAQITARRNDFPKPIWMYKSIDIFGKNVVTTEGANWRHHRKITSPPFTERNNHLVWRESLHQAQSMMAAWIGKDDKVSDPVWTLAAEAMRLSLHVISRAGFGTRLEWPHEESKSVVPPGHTLTYKAALETLLRNVIVVLITPKWLLPRSPLEIHQKTNEAYVEWHKYMIEMYHEKRNEIVDGGSRDGLDLMGALVKGAGITSDSPGIDSKADPEQGSNQLLTDDEIIGNAFVFILAGHETAANTIHFSQLYLAMHMAAQRRLQADLDTIFGDRPVSEWNYDEDVPKLFGSMCGAVMNEELRLIPPVLGIPKTTPKGHPQGLQISGKTYTVPEDCLVTLCTAAVHRNPKHWPHTSVADLHEFRPERWLLDTTKAHNGTDAKVDLTAKMEEQDDSDLDGPDTRSDTAASLFHPTKGAYIPFSDGHRSCLGRRFAQVEILAVLAVVFKHWSVELDTSMFLPDADFATASEEQRRDAWNKADARARDLLRDGMSAIITLQMRKGKVPLRFVRRGEERFKF